MGLVEPSTKPILLHTQIYDVEIISAIHKGYTLVSLLAQTQFEKKKQQKTKLVKSKIFHRMQFIDRQENQSQYGYLDKRHWYKGFMIGGVKVR